MEDFGYGMENLPAMGIRRFAFHSMVCLVCGYLTSNQKVLIYTTHIKKVNAKHCSFTLRNELTDKQ